MMIPITIIRHAPSRVDARGFLQSCSRLTVDLCSGLDFSAPMHRQTLDVARACVARAVGRLYFTNWEWGKATQGSAGSGDALRIAGSLSDAGFPVRVEIE